MGLGIYISVKKTLSLWLVLLALFIQACGLQIAAAPGPEPATESVSEQNGSSDPVRVTDIFIWVQIPSNTPPGETISIEVLDEVTGLPFNAERTELRAVDSTHYGVAMRVPVGALLKYRYLRISPEGNATTESISDAEPVRYRVFLVDGPGEVHDIVSRWADTAVEGTPGRIHGTANDAETGEPIPNLLIFAAGQQTLSLSDGSFQFANISPGTHQVTAVSMDGTYKTFKQNAFIASHAGTPVNFELEATELVTVSFHVSVPAGTLPATPLRMAGNLAQLGNTFSNLGGGISGLVYAMPTLTPSDDGTRYTATLQLPAGVEILYKYTLGDGFWNAEHAADLGFLVRRLYIPENLNNLRVEDRVLTFTAGSGAPAWFDANITAFMPPMDFLSIQFHLNEWMAPIPMWPVTEDRWAFQLISPTQIGGDLTYRYCRSNLCGEQYTISIEQDPDTRSAQVGGAETIVQFDHIKNWQAMSAPAFAITVLDNPVAPRETDFVAGVMFAPAYNRLWTGSVSSTFTEIQRLNANTVILRPTWSAENSTLPVFRPVLGEDPDWTYTLSQIETAQSQELRVALAPDLPLLNGSSRWWNLFQRDGAWWQNWWEQYRSFIIHFADLAERGNVEFLVLDGHTLQPALPGAFPDSPADASARWKQLILEIREHYSGNLAWILPLDGSESAPGFLADMDLIFIRWGAALGTWEGTTLPEMQSRAQVILKNQVKPVAERYNLPIVLLASYPSAEGGLTNCLPDGEACLAFGSLQPGLPPQQDIDLNLAEQMEVYNALLAAVNDTPWLEGFISEGFFPPAGLQDKSTSIHGKPAAEVLRYWFGKLLGR